MPDSAPDSTLVTFRVNDRVISAPAGSMLVDAAAAAGVEIPIFCYEPRLGPPIGACRMCLVEIEGMRGLQTACSTPVANDMVVQTESAIVTDAQDGVLELLLANHPLDCPVCDKGGECPLQDRTFRFGPGRTRTIEPKLHLPKPLELSPRVALDRERCIACFRCVRFSQDISQDAGLTFQERGDHTEIATFDGQPWQGRFTGNTIDLCPVGALTSIPYRFVSRPWDITVTPSVCAGCAMGCNIDVTGRAGEIKRVTGRAEPNMAVEEGWICDRGRWGYASLRSEERVVAPEIIDAIGRRRVPAERAASHAAALLADASVGILLGDTVTLEAAHVARRLAAHRGWPTPAHMGPAWPAALCGVGASVGMDALDAAEVIVVVGGDVCAQQPVAELRLRAALRRGAEVTLIGPRPGALADVARYIPVAPGDLAAAAPIVASLITGARRAVVLWDVHDIASASGAADALAGVIPPQCGVIPLAPGANARGLQLLGLQPEAALRDGECDALLLVGARPVGARWAKALEGATVVEIATWRPDHAPAVLLPRLDPLEEEGTMLSMAGRVQRLRPAARECPDAAAAWEWLLALAVRLGCDIPARTPSALFAHLAADVPALAGMSYTVLGTQGVPLGDGAEDWTGADPGDDRVDDRVDERVDDPAALRIVACRPVFGDGDARRSAALISAYQPARCIVHPDDAARLGVAGAARVRVVTPDGAQALALVEDAAVQHGGAYLELEVPLAGMAHIIREGA